MRTQDQKKADYDARKKKQGKKQCTYWLSDQDKRKVDKFVKELEMIK